MGKKNFPLGSIIMIAGLATLTFPVITIIIGSTLLSDVYAYLEYILIAIGAVLVGLGMFMRNKALKKKEIDCSDPKNKDLEECKVPTK